jgi:periplasmic protein TonB
MTVPFPLNHFDHAHPLRTSLKPQLDRGKLASVALTIAFHAVILAAALTAVHVSHSQVMQELKVSILPQQKLETPKDMAPPPKLIQPAQITMPPPQVEVQTVTPPPVTAQVAAPAPPASTAPAVKSPVTGEGRDVFLARLLSQLNKYKQYPRAARAAHVTGVVMLHFVMDADGKVLSFEIAKSSGRPLLDAEALALIQRAQPLPALPPDFPTRTLDAVVPVEFSLNG